MNFLKTSIADVMRDLPERPSYDDSSICSWFLPNLPQLRKPSTKQKLIEEWNRRFKGRILSPDEREESEALLREINQWLG